MNTQIASVIKKALRGNPGAAVATSSNGQKNTFMLEGLCAMDRLKDLQDRLNKTYQETQEACCIYDVWQQRVDGSLITFGLLVYATWNEHGVFGPGVEFCFSRNKRAVEEGCKQVKEQIWMPSIMLADPERFAEWDKADGIVSKEATAR